MRNLVQSFTLPTPQAARRAEYAIIAVGVIIALSYVLLVVAPKGYDLSQAKYERLENGNIVRHTPQGNSQVWSTVGETPYVSTDNRSLTSLVEKVR